MNRYKVSLDGFNFCVFEDFEDELDEAGEKVLKSANLKPPGSPRMVRHYEMDAFSEHDAIGRFKDDLGIKSTERDFHVECVREAAASGE